MVAQLDTILYTSTPCIVSASPSPHSFVSLGLPASMHSISICILLHAEHVWVHALTTHIWMLYGLRNAQKWAVPGVPGPLIVDAYTHHARS